MIKIVFFTSLMVMISLQGEELNQRLWRELNQAKYHDNTEKSQQQDMAWLEDSLKQNNTSSPKEESVDQVMADFNREQKQKNQDNEDSITLKMAAPRRKSPRRSPALAPASRKKLLQEYEKKLGQRASKGLPLTRQRNR